MQAPSDILTPRLRLAWMSSRFIEASLEGRLEEAQVVLAARLPEGWPDEDARRRLAMRLEQMQATPLDAEWLLRGIVRQEDGILVGIINFHGAPDKKGRAELGYTVFEEHRRRGYAAEAATGMMRWAQVEHGVQIFVVSISPENHPSLQMAASLGFRQVGSQIDELDGEEWVFELKVSGA